MSKKPIRRKPVDINIMLTRHNWRKKPHPKIAEEYAAPGCLTFEEMAKELYVNSPILAIWLRENNWIIRDAGSSCWRANDAALARGDVTYRLLEKPRTRFPDFVVITPSGRRSLLNLVDQIQSFSKWTHTRQDA
ncbi:phage antirepressor KilAC domain-containing protein [Herbaspirillum sp. NPDC087042]|uniref:phage antirepressor KilAC domain-containing protein n=1 Tax=Herbaspirillum sp. NPDC087042 TaxID=3364004 RepID=UPI00380B6DAE